MDRIDLLQKFSQFIKIEFLLANFEYYTRFLTRLWCGPQNPNDTLENGEVKFESETSNKLLN